MLFSVDFVSQVVYPISYRDFKPKCSSTADCSCILEVLECRDNPRVGDGHWHPGILEGQQWIVTASCRLITLVGYSDSFWDHPHTQFDNASAIFYGIFANLWIILLYFSARSPEFMSLKSDILSLLLL